MNGNLPTAVGLPVLGAVLLLVGWWSRRHLDVLVGTVGPDDMLERRRGVMARGTIACMVAGVVLLVGGIVVGVAVLA